MFVNSCKHRFFLFVLSVYDTLYIIGLCEVYNLKDVKKFCICLILKMRQTLILRHADITAFIGHSTAFKYVKIMILWIRVMMRNFFLPPTNFT
jgi:hypothetical protein